MAAGQLPPLAERLPPNPVAIGNPNALFGDQQPGMGAELILRIAPDLQGVGEGRIVDCHFADELELAGAGAA